MKARGILVLLVSAGIGTASFMGCGSSTDNTGPGGSDSTTTGSGSTTVVSSSGGPGVSSVTTMPMASPIGAPCNSDSVCGPGGRCMLPTGTDPTLGGGPVGGYCTKNCTVMTETVDCGIGNSCLTDANMMNGACFQGCTIGPPLQYLDDPLDDMKCHGRLDVRCQSLAMGNTVVCIPTCGADIECPMGRSCDQRLRVCVDTPTMGSPMGDPCDPMNVMCAGTCFNFTGGETMCSSFCALGGDIVDTTDCGGVDKGLCIFSPQGNGSGDSGVCAEACTSHDQCQVPSFWCFGINGITGSLTNNGWCAGEPTCMTQADCMNGTCTDTKFGKFCLDMQWPLGTAAPGTGGAGGAGTGGTGAGTGGAGGSTGTGGTGGTGG